MANLRKRVAACDLERRRPLSGESLPGEPNLDDLDDRPLLSKVRNIKFDCTFFITTRTTLVN